VEGAQPPALVVPGRGGHSTPERGLPSGFPAAAVGELYRPGLSCPCFVFSRNILEGKLLLDLLIRAN